MKSEGQISQKLKQVKFRHLKKELATLLKIAPSNCSNNFRVETNHTSVGVCELDHKSCDAFNDRSVGCALFKTRHDKDEVKTSLASFFDSREIHEIAVRFPDVAALMWTLETREDSDLLPDTEAVFVGNILGKDFWTDSAENADFVVGQLLLVTEKAKRVNELEARNSELCAKNADLEAQLSAKEAELSLTTHEKPWWLRWLL